MEKKYITLFDTINEYATYTGDTSSYKTPNVSYVMENLNVYYERKLYTLTVNYTVVGGDAEAPESYEISLPYRYSYSVSSPLVSGYVPSKAVVNGIITGDTTVNVEYTQN